MSDFTMPSDEARALNPDLDRACIELEKEREMREAATVSLKDMTFWVEGALKCTAWHWDMDQHEAATWCLDEAKKVLEGANTEAAAYQAKMQRLMQAARNLRIAVAGDQPGDEPNVCADYDKLCDLITASRLAEEMSPDECLMAMMEDNTAKTAEDIAQMLEGLHAISKIKDLNIVSNVRAYGKAARSTQQGE